MPDFFSGDLLVKLGLGEDALNLNGDWAGKVTIDLGDDEDSGTETGSVAGI